MVNIIDWNYAWAYEMKVYGVVEFGRFSHTAVGRPIRERAVTRSQALPRKGAEYTIAA
jgi:hypothetical protein